MTAIICPYCGAHYAGDAKASSTATQQIECLTCHAFFAIEVAPSTVTASEDDFLLAEQQLEILSLEQDVEKIFEVEGIAKELRGNTPLILQSAETIWFVKDGNVDIFVAHVEQGLIVGQRTFLFSVRPGQIFMGIDCEQQGCSYNLIAIGGLDTSVLRLRADRVLFLAQVGEFAALGVSTLLDEWCAALLLSLKTISIPNDCKRLKAEGEESLVKSFDYTSYKGVCWVRHQSGSSCLMGQTNFPPIPNDHFFPLYEKIWLQTIEPATLLVSQSLDVVRQDSFRHDLEAMHLFVAQCLEMNARRALEQEQARLEGKARDEKRTLSHALTRLLEVIYPSRTFEEEPSSDPLLRACQLIGKEVGISFVPHPDASKRDIALKDIVQASRVRMREVALKGEWWRQENGALLAYRNDDKRPVALLPKKSGGYKLVNPENDTGMNVTRAVAETLDGRAYMFYKPFPERELTWRDLLALGWDGIRRDLMTVIVMGVCGTLLGMLTPVLTGILFDTVIPGVVMNQLVGIGIILTVCAFSTMLFEMTKSIAMLRLEGKLDCSLQAALVDRLLSLPTNFFREYTAGDLAMRSMGINTIRQVLAGVTIQTMMTAIFSIGYIGLLLYYDRFLTLVALIISFVSIVITVGIGLRYVSYERPESELQGRISGMILQLITGISKLRITGTENRAFVLWARRFSEQRTFSIKSRSTQNAMTVVNAALPMIASMILFYFILSKALDPEAQKKGMLSTGSLIAFLSAYATVQANLLQMSTAFLTTLSVLPVYKRMNPILTRLPEVDTTKTHPGKIIGNIEITQIHFRYKADGPIVLKNVSLSCASGEFVAIVGGSGSGKSTLLRLLLGFETPESGTIYYDGQDLSKVDVLEVRRQLGVVLQNAQILPGSIFQNIAGTNAGNLTINDAWEAARMAGCDQEIRLMPMGMHTMLPPGGGTLSGGQRQRIIIARAIVRKPSILFFDEATSALDNRTQAIVSESIEKLYASRIVIAHRLSTIMHADKIYVMDKGEIVQSGRYDELIKKPGLFAELAKRQIA